MRTKRVQDRKVQNVEKTENFDTEGPQFRGKILFLFRESISEKFDGGLIM